MAKFQFIAIDGDGKERRGMVEAPSRQQASAQIKSYGLMPAKIAVARLDRSSARGATEEGVAELGKKPLYFGSGVKKKELAEFTRKLSTLLQAGLTLIRSLEVLLDQERNPVFKWIVGSLANSIRSGSTFSEALAKFPKEFDFLYVNMTRSGEASGTLDVALARLSTYLDKTQRMKAKLAAAMTYPSVVMTLATLIVIGLLVWVVPSFERIFREQLSGEQMPQLTQHVLAASGYIRDQWMFLLGALAAVFLFAKLLSEMPMGRGLTDWGKLHAPLVGELFRKVYIVRFARTLGTLLDSSVPILEALNITRDTCGNRVIMRAVDKVRNRVKDGEGIARPLENAKIFPMMVSSMVEVGEETGDLPEMLTQIADVYDEEVENSISSLTSIVEPLMIVMLALVVVVIVLALFLPFVKIMQTFAQ